MENVNEENDFAPLVMADLRPHLKRLNWQLRRIGVAVAVTCDDPLPTADELERDLNMSVVKAVIIVPGNSWTVICDNCGTKYEPGRAKIVRCPSCDCVERE